MALLCWSGGCDSTLLLYKLLKSGNKNVRTIAINHHAIDAYIQNRTSRMMILRKLARRWLKVKEHTELNIRPDCGGDWTHRSMGQPSIWQFNAITYLGEKENLYLGYIKPDCIWHYRTELFTIFENVCRISDRSGKLLLPLEWYSKGDVIKELIKVGLDKLVWWCEKPASENDFKPCGKCPPCKTVISARIALSRHMQSDIIETITDPIDQTEEKSETKETGIEVCEKNLSLGPHNCKNNS